MTLCIEKIRSYVTQSSYISLDLASLTRAFWYKDAHLLSFGIWRLQTFSATCDHSQNEVSACA